MKKMHPALLGLIQAVGVIIYVAIISGLLTLMGKIAEQPADFFAASIMLLLLVFSAAICGALVFGYPVYFLINKNVKKALATLGYTLLYFAIVLIIALVIVSVI